jgi:hypothetical protein
MYSSYWQGRLVMPHSAVLTTGQDDSRETIV